MYQLLLSIGATYCYVLFTVGIKNHSPAQVLIVIDCKEIKHVELGGQKVFLNLGELARHT